MRKYYYKILHQYLSLYIRPDDSVAEINPVDEILISCFSNSAKLSVASNQSNNCFELETCDRQNSGTFDYLLLNGSLHYESDIQSFLTKLRNKMTPDQRLITVYYSSLWQPFMRLASRLGLRKTSEEPNWLAHEDIANLFHLADLEPVQRTSKVLIPFYIPLISNIVNRWIAPLPLFNWLSLTNIIIARPSSTAAATSPSVSVVVPARNEAGNIYEIIARCPAMGPDDELIFVEGNSTDNTWQVIQEAKQHFSGTKNIQIAQQPGKGKGDAVRLGFNMAKNEILMILDADMTVPPEDLPKFYDAIRSGKGEFINGSRLVYPMEKRAMRFFNLLGNKFFALAFSWVLGQRFKDTLCGTKVLTKTNYQKLAKNRSYFGEFDPFGDFDLIFGSTRMSLKMAEIPIRYRERTYGDTNISRWRHGAILLAMLAFAARKIKFV